MSTITTVWIESGCICCHACENTLSAVFTLAEGQAEIRADFRIDGMTSTNAHERASLNAVGLEYQESIREAAAGCPIEIIRCSSS